MIRVYLYQKDAEKPDHAWQHRMGQDLLSWAKRQPENNSLCYYNISHSKTLVAVAVADVCVGVDVECRRSVNGRVAARVLSEEEMLYLKQAADYEMTFLQFWTLKECYGKALRVGIAYPMRQVTFIPGEPVRCDGWQRVSCSDTAMSCFSLLKQEYALSVCGCLADEKEPVFYMLQNPSLV